jgi:hypothetical protein
MAMVNQALEYLDRGWVVIPVSPETKRPLVKWQHFQEAMPSEDDVCGWWEMWPEARVGIVTGALSGIVVVDCDNEDALHAAFDAGMRSPVRVKTKRGVHLYFAHPRDGVRRGPRAGVNSRGADWPKIDGLDFRGDGSYVVAPPSNGYEWDIAVGYDIEDTPTWEDWRPAIPTDPSGEFAFEALDLSSVTPMGEFVSVWDETAEFVREKFPSTLKIPTGLGNGRNERVMRYASECVRAGYFDAELRMRCHAFEREFFVDPLRDTEFEATVRSMEEAEKRNHPERFDPEGRHIGRPVHEEVATPAKKRRLITMRDANDLIAQADATNYLLRPWLKKGSITQVYGFSGAGKSLFVQHMMAALAAGRKYAGPFEVGGAAKVLYLDFENGRGTIGNRLHELREMQGDTADRLVIWTPFLESAMVSFKSREGLELLQGLIKEVEPDVVVIDTIRSAWPGMQENSAEEWARINQLALKLRNAGLAVILLHHQNKPSDGGVGREAGSTAQLVTLETQIRITQVYADKEAATINAGIFDGDMERPVWERLQAKAPSDFNLYMVMQIMYGKVREWTDDHERTQYIGFANSTVDGRRMMVSSRSQRQIAKDEALEGRSVEEIADRIKKPIFVVRKWLEL